MSRSQLPTFASRSESNSIKWLRRSATATSLKRMTTSFNSSLLSSVIISGNPVRLICLVETPSLETVRITDR